MTDADGLQRPPSLAFVAAAIVVPLLLMLVFGSMAAAKTPWGWRFLGLGAMAGGAAAVIYGLKVAITPTDERSASPGKRTIGSVAGVVGIIVIAARNPSLVALALGLTCSFLSCLFIVAAVRQRRAFRRAHGAGN